MVNVCTLQCCYYSTKEKAVVTYLSFHSSVQLAVLHRLFTWISQWMLYNNSPDIDSITIGIMWLLQLTMGLSFVNHWLTHTVSFTQLGTSLVCLFILFGYHLISSPPPPSKVADKLDRKIYCMGHCLKCIQFYSTIVLWALLSSVHFQMAVLQCILVLVLVILVQYVKSRSFSFC